MPSAKSVSETFSKIAGRLELMYRSRSLPQSKQRLARRYAPFARALAQRIDFCRELAEIKLTGDMPDVEARRQVRPLVRKYRFPAALPYHDADWEDLLGSARLGHEHFIPDFRYSDLRPTRIDVQLVYEPALRDDSRLRHIVAAEVAIVRGESEVQVAEKLQPACRDLLDRFLPKARRLAKKNVLMPHFTVRIIVLNKAAAAANSEGVVSTFAISLPRGRRAAGILKDIRSVTAAALRRDLDYASTGGSLPDPSVAGWWAKRVFDNLSVPAIAFREAGDDPDRPEREDRIAKALSRLGMDDRTE